MTLELWGYLSGKSIIYDDWTSSSTFLHYFTLLLHRQECMLTSLCFSLKLDISVNIQRICLRFVLSCRSRWVDYLYVVSCIYHIFVMMLRWHMLGNKDCESDFSMFTINVVFDSVRHGSAEAGECGGVLNTFAGHNGLLPGVHPVGLTFRGGCLHVERCSD